jgi:hypothetical protein
MRREWTPEDLIASWTLVDDDWRLVGNKTGRDPAGLRPPPEVLVPYQRRAEPGVEENRDKD